LLLIQPERPLCKKLPDKGKNRQGSINLGGQCGVGKRGTLEKDSSLGLKGIDILHINLDRLVSRRSCTIPSLIPYSAIDIKF